MNRKTKLTAVLLTLLMCLSMIACGGDKRNSDSDASQPASTEATVQEETETSAEVTEETASEDTEATETTGEFTAEQQALAEDFLAMTEAFDAVVDRVNANPDLLADTELIDAMNELADAIIEADAYFADPETLTPEVMESLRAAIDETYLFIDEANAALDSLDAAPESMTVNVEIVNNTGVDIYALALSPANSEDWGDNLIEEIIYDGESVAGDLEFTADTLVWDILIQDSEGTQLTFMGVDFSPASVDGAQLTLSYTDAGEYVAEVTK